MDGSVVCFCNKTSRRMLIYKQCIEYFNRFLVELFLVSAIVHVSPVRAYSAELIDRWKIHVETTLSAESDLKHHHPLNGGSYLKSSSEYRASFDAVIKMHYGRISGNPSPLLSAGDVETYTVSGNYNEAGERYVIDQVHRNWEKSSSSSSGQVTTTIPNVFLNNFHYYEPDKSSLSLSVQFNVDTSSQWEAYNPLKDPPNSSGSSTASGIHSQAWDAGDFIHKNEDDTFSGTYSRIENWEETSTWIGPRRQTETITVTLEPLNICRPHDRTARARSTSNAISANDQEVVDNPSNVVVLLQPHDNTILPDGRTKLTGYLQFCDGVPVKDGIIEFKTIGVKHTGGHNHDSPPRPHGCLNGVSIDERTPGIMIPTDSNGVAEITFQPGTSEQCGTPRGIAGLYEVTAEYINPVVGAKTGVKAQTVMTVEVPGLQHAVGGTNWQIFRRDYDPHPDGTYATAATITGISQLANDFEQAQRTHNQQLAACGQPQWDIYPLTIIDIALPQGGLFDIGPIYGRTPYWNRPHATHIRGEGVDFSMNPAIYPIGGRPVCNGALSSPWGWLWAKLFELGPRYGR